MDDKPKRGRFHPVHLFLVLPFIGLLWVPFYNRVDPTLMGVPFFYWYQGLWTLLGPLCTWPVYRFEERRRNAR
jgi:hypothetical protein